MRDIGPRIVIATSCVVFVLSIALYQMSLPLSSSLRSSFTLPKALWNASLYTRVREVWFANLPPTATSPREEDTKRWFMGGPEAKAAFDKVCHAQFATALESISPANFTPTTSEDAVNPFLAEIKEGDEEETSRTALSLLLLLDQIPRNLFRTKDTLPLVYNHYDPIALALIKHILKMDPRPDLYPSIRGSVVYRQWFYMPLMHSEDVRDHGLFDECMEDVRVLIEEKGDSATEGYLGHVLGFEKKHRDIIEKFGRYPHRNEALGRESTKEEVAFMTGGGDNFGVAG